VPVRDYLVVDVPSAQARLAQRALQGMTGPTAVSWDRLCRSPGSSTASERSLLRGYYVLGAAEGLERRLLMDAVRGAVAHLDALVGDSSLFQRAEAMLVDVGDATALARHRPRLVSCAMLDGRRALAEVSGSQAEWEHDLTRQASESPDACVERLRWRPSVHKGRTWAKPLLLDSSRRAAAQRVRAAAQGGATAMK